MDTVERIARLQQHIRELAADGKVSNELGYILGSFVSNYLVRVSLT